MKIGIISVWFEGGAGYVTRQYKEILEKAGHQVYIFARGGHYPKNDLLYNLPEVYWSKPSHIPISYSFDLKEFSNWLKENAIEVAFFNEQYWWEPITLCHELGIHTGAYIDYYTNETVSFFGVYDFLICNTKRHYSVFKQLHQSFYIPWGTNIGLFEPKSTRLVENGFVTFFHSCGTTPERKGTDQLLNAFELTTGKSKLIIHTQVELTKKFPELRSIIKKLTNSNRLKVILGTISAPGLYHLGDVYIYPTRLDGIGLTMAEALASGLGLITTNNGPMNEFIDGRNGTVIPVSKFYQRSDGYYWPMCDVDIPSLSEIIQDYTNNPDEVLAKKKYARDYAVKFLDWDANIEMIDQIFSKSKIKSLSQKVSSINNIQTFNYSSGDLKHKIYEISPFIYQIIHKIYRMYRSLTTRELRQRSE